MKKYIYCQKKTRDDQLQYIVLQFPRESSTSSTLTGKDDATHKRRVVVVYLAGSTKDDMKDALGCRWGSLWSVYSVSRNMREGIEREVTNKWRRSKGEDEGGNKN